MANIWFELDYEELDDRELNRVLHASPEGLRAFISDLQRIDQVGSFGRYKNQIEGVSENYDAPFDYIELSNNPPEEEEESTGLVDPSYLMMGGVVITVLLAIYAILRLITDFVV